MECEWLFRSRSRQTVTLRLMHRPFLKDRQKTATSWNTKVAGFLRSYLRLLFSCWLRFATSSQPEDNWRNTFRVVKLTPSENVRLSSLPQPDLLSASHTGQKKDPGEHRNKEEADRGGEAEAPVHKGACLHVGFDHRALRQEAKCDQWRGCVAVVVAGVLLPTTKYS